MPKFKFTAPDGKSYTVNGPEGATQEQAFAMLQQQLGATPAASDAPAPVSGAAAIPGASPSQLASARAGMAPQQNSQTFLSHTIGETGGRIADKIVGPIDAAITAVGGAIAAPISVPAGFIKSMYDEKVNGVVRSPQENARIIAERFTPKPATATGRKILETVGEAAPVLEALPGLGNDLANLSRSAAPAVRAAGDVSRAGGARLSDLASNVRVVPRIDQQTASLAKIAQEKYGIPLRPDQLYENRITRMAGEASEKVPFSGAKTDVRQEAFNKAIIRTIGGDETATRVTPDVFDKAISASGQKIGDIAARNPLPLDQKLSSALDSHAANAARLETADVGRIVTGYIDDLRSKAVDGVIPGEAVRKMNTAITTRMRKTTDGDLKHALGELQDDIQDALQTRLSGEDLAAYKTARQQYASAKTVEPLIGKSAVGDVSPASLMGRVTADASGKSRMARGKGGDLGELARIGQRFLKEPPSSGTAERGVAYTLMGGGAVAEPTTAAGVLSLANLYNRAGPVVSRKLTGAAKPVRRTTLAEMATPEE